MAKELEKEQPGWEEENQEAGVSEVSWRKSFKREAVINSQIKTSDSFSKISWAVTPGFGNAKVISDLDKSSCNEILEMQGIYKGMRATGQTVAQTEDLGEDLGRLQTSIVNAVELWKFQVFTQKRGINFWLWASMRISLL